MIDGAALANAADAQVRPAARVAEPSDARPRARPADLGRAALRCTSDGRYCISAQSYAQDVCRTIAATSDEAGLDRDFFVRLIWQESRFDASAVSPAGAEGIAQFMPGTAALRRLDDSFNPAKSLLASAKYLAELRDRFGNIGLAAVAYNAGEERAAAFLHDDRPIPLETRRYVPTITGITARDWRDRPPESLDLTLEENVSFQNACVALAETRRFRDFQSRVPVQPWGVIVAAHPSRGTATQRYERLRRSRPLLDDYEVAFHNMRLPSRPGRQATVQIGAGSRGEAQRICTRLRGGGVPCVVLRN
ncbi:lytic transglycosylase domain-containing protein [Tropicimonas marinistellae]|uniref:lytic transglycosylase domain-containing protein n=1 Tax=Tropicimonas marinistellae TaxID=1739787 RepID=UPI0013732B1A|nr:lytic transglycosylase domain-containing protein [Tropicimonas marinistellae]